MRIDHVTIAGRSIAELEGRFSDLGVSSVYGGAHSNGITHMSIAGLADGSYVELISKIDPSGGDSPWWGRQIDSDAGPCAWALGTDDIGADVDRIRALDVAVRGPIAMNRTLPDGRVARWSVAFLGDGEPGSLLPFLIEDETPREIRVPAMVSSALSSVSSIAIAVGELTPAVTLLRAVLALDEPEVSPDREQDAVTARFTDFPVVLVCPRPGGALNHRLERIGPGPFGFSLVGSTPGGDGARSTMSFAAGGFVRIV